MDCHSIPPEIFATAFEIGVSLWGIRFVPPVCLVCKRWNAIVIGTSSLWGIISVENIQPSALQSQITRAKSSPLVVKIPPYHITRKPHERAIERLIRLSPNWISADVGTDSLTRCHWGDLCSSLGILNLRQGFTRPESSAFFNDEDRSAWGAPLKLHSFSAHGLEKSWILDFLSPSIKYFHFRGGVTSTQGSHSTSDTLLYLSRIPQATTIELENLRHCHRDFKECTTVVLYHLRTLKLSSVLCIPNLLSGVSTPHLKTLIVAADINDWGRRIADDTLPMALFFSQWSQPSFIPYRLHTLELVDCLLTTDVPFLIRWLSRLPNLIRLILIDDAIGQAATPSTAGTGQVSLYEALASPTAAAPVSTGWLCPSLMQLHLDTDLAVIDLIGIARARGGIAQPVGNGPSPARLRRLYSPLCPGGNREEISMLISLMDLVECSCFGCVMSIRE
ncbi:hypothetical protein B0H34DRAFT_137889 [Crassisporium funariophilum]|nr:hypothetical protein B0H34DRAFT_137889 [Crassisporium funariophilum]